ncbi:hypothetical protein [Streptomyces sp. NBC_00057]|uniref:hypothetical protein n=1 Tax=Streptomyces sp. NBC_00057 TaxID=2975634 RepID=UPI003250EF61
MTPSPARKSTCPNCMREFVRETKPGRPRNYCSDVCRNQASRRKKTSGEEAVHDPARHDALLAEVALDLQQAVKDLVNATRNQLPSADLLRHRAVIIRLCEDLEAVSVRRGRDRGESWDTMSGALGLSRDRLRKGWTLDAFDRRMDRRPTPSQRPPATAGLTMLIPQQRPPDTQSSDTAAEADPDAGTSPHQRHPAPLLPPSYWRALFPTSSAAAATPCAASPPTSGSTPPTSPAS